MTEKAVAIAKGKTYSLFVHRIRGIKLTFFSLVPDESVPTQK